MGPELTPPEPTPEELRALLGAYAIGAVDDVEREQVERFVREDHEARADLHALQLGAAWLDHASRRAPSHVWDRIADELDDAVREEPSSGDLARARGRRAGAWSPRRLLAVAAALVLVVVVAGGAAVLLGGGSDSTSGLVAASRAAARDPRSTRLALTNPDGRTQAEVVVTPSGTAYLVDSRFAPARPGRTYQLWTVTPAGTKSAGVLGPRPSVHRFTVGDDVSALAVTVERAPGVRSSSNAPVATASVA